MIKRAILSLLLVVSVIGAMPIGASAKWKEDKYKNRTWVENGVVAKGWKEIEGNWYNFGDNGVMRTGWMMDNGNWYYLWSNGTMAYNSWLTNGGFWYYFDESGKMVYDSVVVQDRQYDFKAPAVIFSENVNKDSAYTSASTDNNAQIKN